MGKVLGEHSQDALLRKMAVGTWRSVGKRLWADGKVKRAQGLEGSRLHHWFIQGINSESLKPNCRNTSFIIKSRWGTCAIMIHLNHEIIKSLWGTEGCVTKRSILLFYRGDRNRVSMPRKPNSRLRNDWKLRQVQPQNVWVHATYVICLFWKQKELHW